MSADRDSRIDQIVEQYLDDLQSGSAISADSLCEQNPDLQPELGNRLQLVNAVAGVLGPKAEQTVPILPAVDKLRCPHCGNPVNVVHDESDLVCRSCGSSFAFDSTTPTARQSLDALSDRFHLIERAGRGAFGIVYLARDNRLNRDVAVKVPRSGHFDSLKEARAFLDEAQNAAHLEHPNIVRVYEVGDAATPFIVSEFVKGTTLREYIGTNRLGFRESAEVVATVADAIHYAHSMGVIHRDIKPSNILMDDMGQPHVADFGLALKTSATITITREGELVGTPAYMSPEQAATERVDVRSDVYSLGVVLYRSLTGVLPFQGSQQMLLRQVMEEEPSQPRKINEHIPHDLETITLRAMAKEPGSRFSTAEEFAEDLRRWLAGKTIVSRPANFGERLWKWCRRRPMVSSLSALVLLLLISIAVLSMSWAIDKSILARETQQAMAETLTQQALETINPHPSRSLPQFVETLRIQELLGDDDKASVTRIRLGQTLNAIPPLSHYARQEHRVDSLAYLPNGSQLLVASGIEVESLSVGSWTTNWKLDLRCRSRELIISPTGDRLISLPHHSANTGVFNAPKAEAVAELWDLDGPRRIGFLPQGALTTSASFSQTRPLAVTTSLDGKATVWNTDTAAQSRTLNQPGRIATNAWFAPSGDYMLIESRLTAEAQPKFQPLFLRRYRTDNWQQQKEWRIGTGDRIVDVVFDDKPYAITASRQIHELSTTSDSTPIELRNGSSQIVKARLAAPGLLAIRSRTDTFTWSLPDKMRIAQRVFRDSAEDSIFELADDGTFYATVSENETIAVRWTSDSHSVCNELPVNGRITSLAISADNRYIAVTNEDGSLMVWDLAGTTRKRWRLLSGNSASSPQYTKDSAALSAIVDEEFHLWNIVDDAVDPMWTAPGELSAFNTYGDLVAIVTNESRVELRASEDGRVKESIDVGSRIVQMLFSRVGVVCGLESGKLFIWNPKSKLTSELNAHEGAITSLALHPTRDVVASAGKDRFLKIWNIDNGSNTGVVMSNQDVVSHLKFSPDGNGLLSVSRPWTTVWNWQNGSITHRHRMRIGKCNAIFSAGSKFLFSPSKQDFVSIWKIGRSIPESSVSIRRPRWIRRPMNGSLAAFSGGNSDYGYLSVRDHDDLERTGPDFLYRSLPDCAFAPNGRSLLTTSMDGHVDFLRVESTDLRIAQLSRLAAILSHQQYTSGISRRLSTDEIEQHFQVLKRELPHLFQATESQQNRWQRQKQQERSTHLLLNQ